MNSNSLLRGYLAAIGSAIFWGVDAVIIRILVVQGIDPTLVAFLRLSIGAASIGLCLLLIPHLRRSAGSIVYSKLFWMISVSLAVNFILFQLGLKFTIASDAVLLEAFAPVMVLILAMIFFRSRVAHLVRSGETIQRVFNLVIIGSIGSSLLLINDPKDILSANENKLWGDLIEFLGMFAWALFLIGIHEYHDRYKNLSPLAVSVNIFIVGALILLPFTEVRQIMQLNGEQWLWLGFLGIFSTGIAYVLWHEASKRLDILPLMTIFNLVSIFTILTESIVLRLTLSWKLLLGSALILWAAYQASLLNAKYRLLEKEETAGE